MITLYLRQFNKIIRNADLKIFDSLSIDDVLWIDMLEPSFKEQRIVEVFMDVSLQTRQQIEEIETSSKYSESAKSIVSNANFFIPKSDDDFTIEPVSFIITKTHALVSVHTHEMRTFRDAERRLQVTPKNYPTGFHIFASLLEVRVDYDADLVEATAKAVAALSRDIAREDNIDKEFIRRIGRLQENTMVLRENIFDRQRVLWMIRRSERFPRDISPRVQLMIKDVNSLISYADFTFQRLDYIQDSALGLINIEQNEIVKIFSVASVIFMPATLIASVYGMNFKFMPELDWNYTMESGYVVPAGYIFAIFLMLLCSGFTIWFFRYKKWL
ncbi:MAG: CorA family divalent cation transporter [Rikenellaceae bacterium]